MKPLIFNLKQYKLYPLPEKVVAFDVIECPTHNLHEAEMRLPQTPIDYLLHPCARWLDIDCNVGAVGTVFRLYDGDGIFAGSIFKPPVNSHKLTHLAFEAPSERVI